MKTNAFLWILILCAVVVLCVLFVAGLKKEPPIELPLTETEEENIPSPTEQLPYGEVVLHLGETAAFPDVRITPQRVIEDSRCPIDVQCIQAGTVQIELLTVSAMGTSTSELFLGERLTTEAEEISFVAATPSPQSETNIQDEAYQFTLVVIKRTSNLPEDPEVAAPITQQPTQGTCYVGGCSSQLCTDNPDIASTCEYREEYACYQNAVCERQSSGQCGWTETSELRACLLGAQ